LRGEGECRVKQSWVSRSREEQGALGERLEATGRPDSGTSRNRYRVDHGDVSLCRCVVYLSDFGV
jgi:hypothetical protein